MKKITLLLFLFFIIQKTNAQITNNKKARANFEKAQIQLNSNNYEQAVQLLQDAVKADPGFQFAFIQLGDINRKLKAYELARQNYTKAIVLGGNLEPRFYYGYAEAEIYTGDYTNALKNITHFINTYKGDDPDFINKAKKYLKDCEFAIEALKNPIKYELVNIGPQINSKYRDYFPSVTADGNQMIFTRKIDDNEDFFLSTRKENMWTTPIPLSEKINTSKYNEGAQSISPDGMYLFFTGCNRPDGFGRCDIYVSHKNGKNWGEPFNLGAPVNSSYWESQPAISPDGTTLYFVSNRPGGIGGYDIWKSKLNADGYWTVPENLGPDINTPYDEHTPFIHPDGKTLYFSSNGWPGMGDKDIFLSRINETGKWSKPENLGYPINTFNEETGLIVSPDGTYGLFSSILEHGYGDMDIYQFKMPESKKPLPITYVKGIVTDKETKAFLEARVQVVDLKTKQLVYNDYTSVTTGDFLAVMPINGNYAFNVSADGYLFYSENYQLDDAYINKPFIISVNLDKLVIGKTMVMRNIFFNTNEYNILPASLIELNTLVDLLKNNASIEIEIQGHTDNIGSDIQNEKLSLQRAKAVYDFLIENGIKSERLSFKGYGKTKPIVNNDTEAQRKQNRRTSFLITKN
ncbi:OmpA family protein [Pedobacter nyackensis]|uniref:OmpA family protein n=1 Tax=Pedobacter nyackensis TaxID=475255 RepID=UPI00292CB918|nr:OmpA family protein [Pedobacter nyackensis]